MKDQILNEIEKISDHDYDNGCRMIGASDFEDLANKIYNLKSIKRKEPISHNSFVKNAKRFEKIANKTIDSWYDDKDFKAMFDRDVIYIVRNSIEKLIKTHKKKPFKTKSAFTDSVKCFRTINNVIKDVRVSYNLSETELTFKLLTRTQSHFKRKCQFVLKIK